MLVRAGADKADHLYISPCMLIIECRWVIKLIHIHTYIYMCVCAASKLQICVFNL